MGVALFDQLPSAAARLDADAVIVEVNEAWRRFGAARDADPARSGVGRDYLAITDGLADCAAMSAAIRGVLEGRGRVDPFLYPCHGPERLAWFSAHVLPSPDDGAIVVHELVAARPRDLSGVPDPPDRLPWLPRLIADVVVPPEVDPVTGLAHRVVLREHLVGLPPATLARTALVLVDLGGMARLEDRFGGALADRALRLAGARLAAAVQPGDLVAREDDTRFVIVVQGVDLAAPAQVAARAQRAIGGRPFQVGPHRLGVRAAVRTVVLQPDLDPVMQLEAMVAAGAGPPTWRSPPAMFSPN